MFFYAVARGHHTGIFTSWSECQQETNSYTNAKFKKFRFYQEALNYLQDNNVDYSVSENDFFEKKANHAKKNKKDKRNRKQKVEERTENKKDAKKDSNHVDIVPMENIDCDFIVFTDGSCLKNPEGPGGFAGFIISPTSVVQVSGGEHSTTNNRMELRAIIETLKQIRPNVKVELFSDSQYFIKAIEHNWIKNWKQKNWVTTNGTPVKNVDLWKEIDSLISSLKINYHWVKGHNGISYNEKCDKLARKEADNHWDKPLDNASYTRQSQVHISRIAIDYKTFQNVLDRTLLKTKNKQLNYENNQHLIQDRVNENLLDDLRLKSKFDNSVKEPKQILDISVRDKSNNEKIAKYRVFFNQEYNAKIKEEFMKRFLEDANFRKPYLIIGNHWDGIIKQMDEKTGVNQICLSRIKELNKKDNPTTSEFIHLRVGGKDKYSLLSGTALLNEINISDLEEVKKEDFNSKEMESVLRWLLRGLNLKHCIKKVKIDRDQNLSK